MICALTVYTGPNGATIPLQVGISRWGPDYLPSSECGGGYRAKYQTQDAGTDVVSASPSPAVDCSLADADAHSGWTWFRLSRLADGTVRAEWSAEDITAIPTSGWVLLSIAACISLHTHLCSM